MATRGPQEDRETGQWGSKIEAEEVEEGDVKGRGTGGLLLPPPSSLPSSSLLPSRASLLLHAHLLLTFFNRQRSHPPPWCSQGGLCLWAPPCER